VAISFVAASANGGVSISSMPSHVAGDMLLLWICTINGPPSIPSGWVVLSQANISTTYYTLAYRLAQSDAEMSGSWTPGLGGNYTAICCACYRSTEGKILAVGSFSNSGGTSAGSGQNVNYASSNSSGIADSNITGKWQIGMICHRMGDTDIDVAPSGMTARCDASGTLGAGAAMHDTAANDASWPSTNYTLTAGTSGAYRTHVLELIETDYEAGGGGGNIIVTEE